MISQYFHLETFAKQLNVCLDDLLNLNPNIKRGAIPEGTKNFALRIPADLKDTVVSNRAFFYDAAGKVEQGAAGIPGQKYSGSTYGREKQVYRVRSGDVLGSIANRYGVRVTDIKSWNNLNSNMIRVGQYLQIWVLPTYNSSTKDLYASSARTENKTVVLEGKKVHYVQNGDTLWEIANTYAGLSIEKIKALNNLTSNTIKPGQQLIISSE